MINLNKQNVIALEKRAQATQRLAQAEESIARSMVELVRLRKRARETNQTAATPIPPPLPPLPPPML